MAIFSTLPGTAIDGAHESLGPLVESNSAAVRPRRQTRLPRQGLSKRDDASVLSLRSRDVRHTLCLAKVADSSARWWWPAISLSPPITLPLRWPAPRRLSPASARARSTPSRVTTRSPGHARLTMILPRHAVEVERMQRLVELEHHVVRDVNDGVMASRYRRQPGLHDYGRLPYPCQSEEPGTVTRTQLGVIDAHCHTFSCSASSEKEASGMRSAVPVTAATCARRRLCIGNRGGSVIRSSTVSARE